MGRLVAAFVLLLAGLAGAVWWLQDTASSPAVREVATVASLLGAGDDDGFRRAQRPGGIELPRDHGPHPDYRSEWWYFTGNLATATGREFGFQLTFFRYALGPAVPRASAWATNQAYMVHVALTDTATGEHRAVERIARGAEGLAGARARPFRVWLDGFSAGSTGESFLPLRLRAPDADTGIALDLELEPGKGPVLQGDRGLSIKGAQPGNASWYYSYTRLPVRGSVTSSGATFRVRGSAWLDREWGTSSLEAGVVGWDWFALQLADGRELMVYALRREDGGFSPQSAGTLVAADGSSRALGAQQFQLESVDYWRSPATGVAWPVRWRVRVPAQNLDLDVSATVVDQEQDLSVRYWEGAVDLRPHGGGRRVGRGYLEMTGYRIPPANSAP